MPDWRRRLQALWYRRPVAPAALALIPVAAVFASIAAIRRFAYRVDLLRSFSPGRPVVVVGNLTVGGTGKTPVVIWLAERLIEAGRRPGIVARGVGGQGGVQLVGPGIDPSAVGDEPVLVARRTGVPVAVGRDRVAAARALIAAHPELDVIISDDGLQHYRLRREVEIAVVDGRGFGNGLPLPAGPLREPRRRLFRVAALVVNGGGGAAFGGPDSVRQFAMELDGQGLISVDRPDRRTTLGELGGQRLCAVAGIGDPERFFASLRASGLRFEARAFPDHHAYCAADLAFATGAVLLMTEKDAVKCRGLHAGEAWFLPVSARIDPDLAALVLEKLDGPQTA